MVDGRSKSCNILIMIDSPWSLGPKYPSFHCSVTFNKLVHCD